MSILVEPHTNRFTIRTAEVDMFDRLKLSSLFLMMQEVAARHASMYGFGFDDLVKQQTFWVLSRVKVAILQMPMAETVINIKTWPRGVDKLFALRDFVFTDASDNYIGAATTSWLVVDRQSLRPRRPDILKELTYPHEAALGEEASRLTSHEHAAYSHSVTARFSDIDINRHVNNSRYIDWMLDALTPEEMPYRDFSFEVNFCHQLAMDETINLYQFKTGETCFFEGRMHETTHVIAQLKRKCLSS